MPNKLDLKPFETLKKFLEDHKRVANITEFTPSTDHHSPSGYSASSFVKRNNDNQEFLLKESSVALNPNIKSSQQNDWVDLMQEYIFSNIYQRMLYDRTSINELVTVTANDLKTTNDPTSQGVPSSSPTKKIYLRSKIIDDFKTIGDYVSKYKNKEFNELIEKLEGFEKIIATTIATGDVDIHRENLGIIKQLDEDGKEKYVLAKIDHGKAGSIKHQSEEDIRESLSTSFKKFNYQDFPFNLSKFKDAINEICKISPQEIEKLIQANLYKLSKAGFDLSKTHLLDREIKMLVDANPQMTGLDFTKIHLTSPSTKIPASENITLLSMYYTNIIVNNMTQLRDLSKSLEMIERIEPVSQEWLNGKGFSQIQHQDIIGWTYSVNCERITADGPNAQLLSIDGKDPIDYAKEHQMTIESFNPDDWKQSYDKAYEFSTLIHTAYAKGDYQEIEAKIREYRQVHKEKYINIIQFGVNSINESLINYAINKDAHLLRLLVQNVPEFNAEYINEYDLLHDAIQHNNKESLKILLEYKPNLLKRDDEGQIPLHLAANLGNLEIFKYLIENANANIDTHNSFMGTASHIFARNKNLEGIKYMLERNADLTLINARRILARDDIYKFEIISKAIHLKDNELLGIMKEKDYDSFYKLFKQHYGNVKYTLLHQIAEEGNVEMFDQIMNDIDKDPDLIDINILDNIGRSPLNYALFRNPELAEKLINQGADLNIYDLYNKSVLECAYESQKEIASKMLSHENFLLTEKLILNLIDTENKELICFIYAHMPERYLSTIIRIMGKTEDTLTTEDLAEIKSIETDLEEYIDRNHMIVPSSYIQAVTQPLDSKEITSSPTPLLDRGQIQEIATTIQQYVSSVAPPEQALTNQQRLNDQRNKAQQLQGNNKIT